MYGGLFGDLPSAKGGNDDDDKKNTAESSNTGGFSPSAAEAVKQPTRSATSSDTNPKKQPSVLSALGSKGTAMSFMPTALRQRKRPAPMKPVPASVVKMPMAIKLEPIVPEAIAERSVEQVRQSAEKEDESTEIPSSNLSAPNLEDESEELRQLHASVVDPYDPHLPNDLHAYWGRKAAEKQRMKLEEEARETLKRQQRLREELEMERQHLEKKGNINEIVQHRVQTSMGRGRGRGVSNLPAWVVNKQNEEARLGSAQADDSLKRTVVLSNLTAPGRIDEDLCDEVKEECEDHCGKVETVSVKDANPPTQPVVEVTVRFQKEEDAQKAANLFHGRIFGQRRITASRLGT
jgi:hypothetical protein